MDEIVRVCLSWLGIVRVLVVMDWIVRGLVEDGIGWLSWLVLEGLVVMDGIVRGLVVISGNVRGWLYWMGLSGSVCHGWDCQGAGCHGGIVKVLVVMLGS